MERRDLTTEERRGQNERVELSHVQDEWKKRNRAKKKDEDADEEARACLSLVVRGLVGCSLASGTGRIKVRYRFLKGEIHHFGGQKRERKEQEKHSKGRGWFGTVVASLCSCKEKAVKRINFPTVSPTISQLSLGPRGWLVRGHYRLENAKLE